MGNQLRATWCVIVRTYGAPGTLANAVRQRLKAIHPALPIFDITPSMSKWTSWYRRSAS
jgi:hypothetical protein